MIRASPQKTDVAFLSTSQVSIVNNMAESLTVCHALAFGSRRFQEGYITLISVIEQFNVRKDMFTYIKGLRRQRDVKLMFTQLTHHAR